MNLDATSHRSPHAEHGPLAGHRAAEPAILAPPPLLTALGTANAALGLGFALAAVVAPDQLEDVYRLLATAGTEVDLPATARLSTAIYGGLMAGWGVTLALLGAGRSISRAAALGVLTWWLVDSAGSVLTGFAWNALSNTLFLLLFAPVLLAARREASAS